MAELVYLWELCKPASCKTWQESRGPISRACLSLARAGWKCRGPSKWVDHNDHDVDLTQTPQSLLKDMLELGVQRQREFRLA
eukprot:1265867-Pyramimonas_sp.AAC.1